MMTELMTFGIPVQFLPLSIEGKRHLDDHKRWIEERKVIEGSATASEENVIFAPNAQDVLLGRNKSALIHPGNLRYHELVRSNMDRYDAAGETKHERTAICHEIVLAVKEKGGRFLKQEDVGWICIDDSTAKEKVSTAFRNRRKKINENLEKKQRRRLSQISETSGSTTGSNTTTPSPLFGMLFNNNSPMEIQSSQQQQTDEQRKRPREQ
jgi:hypothetical protein